MATIVLIAVAGARAATTITNVFDTSGYWTAPAGVTSVEVRCWGGGGGSGSAKCIATTTVGRLGGGGGAGGACAVKVITVTSGNTYEYTVGAGGTAGVAGQAGSGGQGGGSWFDSSATVFAEGGAGGANGFTVVGTPGIGSKASSIGDITYQGGNGATIVQPHGGAGGGSAGSAGDGGSGTGGTVGGTAGFPDGALGAAGGTGGSSLGNPGFAPGGGAGGAKAANTLNDTRAGAIGGAGRVVLIYTIPFNNLEWVGDGSNNRWSTSAGNLCWDSDANGSADTGFMDGDVVLFGLSGASNPNLEIQTTVVPTSLSVNTPNDYTLTGAGKISGETSLAKSGAGTLTLSTANDYSGGTTHNGGKIRLGHNTALGSGLVTLAGGALSSDGATARTLANALTISANSVWGDPADTGTLTVNGAVDLGAAGRILTNHSDVVFARGMSNGRITSKYGAGTLTLQGAVNFNGVSEVREGTMILDGASVANSSRLAVNADGATTLARMVIANGSTVTLTSGNANLRAGIDATGTGTNIVDLAGVFSTPLNPEGRILLRNTNSAYSEVNLLAGGDFTCRGAVGDGGWINPTRLNFNGGILRASTNEAAYCQGITEAYIRSGGATIDDRGFTIAINQDLLDGGGDGRLDKIGTGTLLLNGANTYLGSTVVSNGTLGGVGAVSGPLVLRPAATLSPGTNAIGTFTAGHDLSLQGNVVIEIDKSLSPSHDAVAVAGSLTYGGTLTATNIGTTELVAGDQFPVLPAGGTGSLTILGSPGAGLAWSFSPATGILSVVNDLVPIPLEVGRTNNVLTFSWTNAAFKLQWQTNALGIWTNWFDYPGGASSPVMVTNDASYRAVFFRLIAP